MQSTKALTKSRTPDVASFPIPNMVSVCNSRRHLQRGESFGGDWQGTKDGGYHK